MKRALEILRTYAELCSKNEISTAAAALSYYLTLTFFPLIICLYALLGSNYEKALRVFGFVYRLIPEQAGKVVADFILYVSQNHSAPMLATGIAALVSTSSAAVRSMQAIIGKMQGGQRFHGIRDVVFSVLFSLLFIAALYFSVLILLTGREALVFLSKILPFVSADSSWTYLRFLLLAGIELMIIRVVYSVSKREEDDYSTVPGAAFATVAIVAVSFVFSVFIGASAKYPLIYGSLAALILLMFWLYLCCMVIYLGAALNIVLDKML